MCGGSSKAQGQKSKGKGSHRRKNWCLFCIMILCRSIWNLEEDPSGMSQSTPSLTLFPQREVTEWDSVSVTFLINSS